MRRSVRWSGLLLSLVAVLALVLLAGCGARGGQAGSGEEQAYTLKFSHVAGTDTPKGLAAEKFKEVLEQKSGGRITVEIYPNSQLYGDEDEMQALQSGAVQVLAPGAAKFGTIAPQLQVLDLPFIFDSPDEVQEVVSRDSAVGEAIYNNEDLANANMKVMGLWDLGFKQFASNKAIREPDDLVGQKMRIQSGSDVLRSQMEAWGVRPTPMAFSEVYNALQQGVIDGLENTYSSFYSQKMHTVQDYITVSNHGYIGYVMVINDDFFESLPEDLRQAVTEAADEATTYNREIAFQNQEEARGAIEEAGTSEFIELSEEQRQALKEEVVPEVWDEYADVIGEDVIRELKARQGE
jgi:C4-dicarboxylate-binding protein DctP